MVIMQKIKIKVATSNITSQLSTESLVVSVSQKKEKKPGSCSMEQGKLTKERG
jgi:hypothetical protein